MRLKIRAPLLRCQNPGLSESTCVIVRLQNESRVYTRDILRTCGVFSLREHLRSRGLSTVGNKSELVERLYSGIVECTHTHKHMRTHVHPHTHTSQCLRTTVIEICDDIPYSSFLSPLHSWQKHITENLHAQQALHLRGNTNCHCVSLFQYLSHTTYHTRAHITHQTPTHTFSLVALELPPAGVSEARNAWVAEQRANSSNTHAANTALQQHQPSKGKYLPVAVTPVTTTSCCHCPCHSLFSLPFLSR